MSRLADRFDAVRGAEDDRALALQLKFDVTDFNGWQTAYGYDSGRSRPIFLAAVHRFRVDLTRARATFARAEERALLDRVDRGADTFMQIDARAWAALRAG